MPLLVIKISIEVIGLESYGIWMAILSFFSLFNFADLGLGSGLQTKLSKYQNRDKPAEIKTIISSVLVLLIIISAVLTLVFSILINLVNWNDLLNVGNQSLTIDTLTLVLIVVISKIINIPLGIIQRVQFSFQEGFHSNLWGIGSSILTIFLLVLSRSFELLPVHIVMIVTFTPIFFLVINYIYFFYFKNRDIRPQLKFVELKETISQLRIGTQFLLLSILTTLGLTIDNFIVIRTSSLEDVSTYSIAFRVASMLGIIISVLSYPLWSANAEAVNKKDYKWIKETTRKISRLSTALAVLVSSALLVFSSFIFEIWLGNSLSIPFYLLLGLLLMQVVQAFISPYFMYLNSISNVKTQVLLFLIFTPISTILKYYISLEINYILIPWIGSILYLIIIVFPIYIIVNQEFKKNI